MYGKSLTQNLAHRRYTINGTKLAIITKLLEVYQVSYNFYKRLNITQFLSMNLTQFSISQPPNVTRK